ncbi:hypothetical protein PG985_004869 [Apiospora marii]|uniref:uncharacterized protein n=1 Tax=Apiospora marii TaxID=335849 RepID=UPI00312EBD5B
MPISALASLASWPIASFLFSRFPTSRSKLRSDNRSTLACQHDTDLLGDGLLFRPKLRLGPRRHQGEDPRVQCAIQRRPSPRGLELLLELVELGLVLCGRRRHGVGSLQARPRLLHEDAEDFAVRAAILARASPSRP